MFTELYDRNNNFRKKYMENLVNRFTNASLGVEGVEGDLADTMQAMNIYQQTQAMDYAFSIPKDEMLNVGIIKELEKIVTGEEYENFRTTQAEVNGSNVRRTKANMIYMEMYTLLDNYYNIWKDLDPFLREAYFHIRFLHIHPFQDGNGRTARVLLIRNLCASGEVPCVITKEVKDEYCSYIENNDAEGLANFFRKISKKEFNTIMNLYKRLDSMGLIKENNMTKKQLKTYNSLVQNSMIETPSNDTEYPLRKLENLVELFKYNNVSNGDRQKININGICNINQIKDNNSNDVAVYYEDTRLMSIYLEDDERIFKIRQQLDDLVYTIEDPNAENLEEKNRKVLPGEFEYELSHSQTKNQGRSK